MAVCKWCNREMSDDATITCTGNLVVEFPDGEELPAVKYTIEHYLKRAKMPWLFQGEKDKAEYVSFINELIQDKTHRFHDCHVAWGGYHHPGCDVEDCPRCGGQLIGCGCLDDEDEDDSQQLIDSKKDDDNG